METKRCSKCEKVKPLSQFYRKSANEDGLETQCKQCHTETRAEKRKAKSEYLERCLAKNPKYAHLCRPEYVKEAKEQAKRKQEKKQEQVRKYQNEHHEEIKERSHQYYVENREKIKEQRRQYCAEHREEINEYHRQWRAKNRERINEYERQRQQKNNYKSGHRWRAENPNYHHQYRIDNAGKYRAYTANRKALSIAAEGTFTDEQFVELCNKYGNRCLCCGRNDVKLVADHIVPLSKGGSNDISNIQGLCGPCNSKKHTKTIDYRPDIGRQDSEEEDDIEAKL